MTTFAPTTASEPLRLRLQPNGAAAPDAAQSLVHFIGNATMLLRHGGFTILTDPNFLRKGDRVPLGYGLYAVRRTDPAMDLADLPPIDLVILSHFHGDHFDPVVQERLDKETPIVTTAHAASRLRDLGFRSTHALLPWQRLVLEKGASRASLTAMPGRHGRKPASNLLPPVMGSMLEFEGSHGRAPLRVYISGDTLVNGDIREIPRRYPDIDCAILHLGGTRIAGALVTMDAKEGLEMTQLLGARRTLAVHYDDYTVFKSPIEDYLKAVAEAGLWDRVHVLARGETCLFDAPAGTAAAP